MPRRAAPPGEDRGARSGQALWLLLMLLTIMVFVALWHFDLHKLLTVKGRAQFAGDAAALAAARWQGATLNTVGALNVAQALALMNAVTAGDPTYAEAREIAELSARVALTGPLIGLAAAQQAARQNGLRNNRTYTDRLRAHALTVAAEYDGRYAPPYAAAEGGTAWGDYAAMLSAVATDGLCVWPDNTRYYGDFISRDHALLDPDFYDAVASGDWCWFLFHADGLLDTYGDWHDWPGLPRVDPPDPSDAEFFGVGLTRLTRLAQVPAVAPDAGRDGARAALDELERHAGRALDTNLLDLATAWYAHDPVVWRPWRSIIPADFPFLAPIREEYDYIGADAAVRLETPLRRLMPGGATDTVAWTAAAKPFGALDGPLRPNAYGLVFPVFSAVRLIPMDVSTAPAGGSRPGWWEHIHEHLEGYLEHGPAATPGDCWYCQQLAVWEDPAFRETGRAWLAENRDRCHTAGPGPGSGGGARRGH